MSSAYALPMPSLRSSGAPLGRGFGYRVAALPTHRMRPRSLSVLDAGIRHTVKTAMQVLATDVFIPLFTARSAEEFEQLRDEAYEVYCEKLSGVNTILSILSSDALDEAKARDHELRAVGSDRMRLLPWKLENGPEEVLFCLSTLIRANEMVQMGIVHVPLLDPGKQAQDRDLASKYGQNSMWAQMHIDTLLHGLEEGLETSSDALDGLVAGMRAALHAYSAAALALDLRVAPPEVDWSPEADEQFNLFVG